MVTRTSASVPARPARQPAALQPARPAARDSVLAPNAAEKKPAKRDADLDGGEEAVGVAEQLLDGLARGGRSRPSPRTWDSRRETRAISAPEKTPPIRTKTTTMTMLSQTSLTGGVLLGVVGWGVTPPWCLVGAAPAGGRAGDALGATQLGL